MRLRFVLTPSLLIGCAAEPRPPIVDAAGGPQQQHAPPPLLPPPSPPTPGHLAVNHRGLVCILRGDGAVACDRFGQPAELFGGPSPVLRLSRSEEWICTHHADAVRCRRGDEEASFAADALVTAGGRTLCSVLGDQLTCFGAGTDRAGERLERRLQTDDVLATAVDEGLWCSLRAGGQLSCLRLDDPIAVSLEREATPLRSIDLGGDWICGLDDDGRTHCGTVDGRLPLQPVPGAPAAQLLAVGTHHTCVLSAFGHVACWRHPQPSEETTTFAAPYIVDLPLHDVVALDADGAFTASLDARRGLYRWRIGPANGALLTVQLESLPGLDNPAPPSTPECVGCRWVTQLGDGRCVKDPDESGVVTTYTTCAMRCCWAPPDWSR